MQPIFVRGILLVGFFRNFATWFSNAPVNFRCKRHPECSDESYSQPFQNITPNDIMLFLMNFSWAMQKFGSTRHQVFLGFIDGVLSMAWSKWHYVFMANPRFLRQTYKSDKAFYISSFRTHDEKICRKLPMGLVIVFGMLYQDLNKSCH